MKAKLIIVTELVNAEAAADILGLSTVHVRRLLRSGNLKGWKVGRDWVIQLPIERKEAV